MADEANDALIPEAPSPEAAAPIEAPAHDPYEKRYNDLRAEFDRRNALIDRARNSDPEAFQELKLPVQFEEADPTPDEYEDPYSAKLQEYEQKLARLEAAEQAREAERIANSIRTHVDQLATEAGVELTDYDREVIFRGAISGEEVNSDSTAKAFESHASYLNSIAERYNVPATPSRPGTGQAVEKQPDLDDPQERREWMKSQLGL